MVDTLCNAAIRANELGIPFVASLVLGVIDVVLARVNASFVL